jgi:DNA-directed RNA polymerase subunit RPC12/RpoP
MASTAEARIYGEYEAAREANETLDGAGYVDCADCSHEIHGESDDAIVMLGVVRCPECTINLAIQSWRDPASWAALSLAERAEVLDALGTECNRAESEIRRQIRQGMQP